SHPPVEVLGIFGLPRLAKRLAQLPHGEGVALLLGEPQVRRYPELPTHDLVLAVPVTGLPPGPTVWRSRTVGGWCESWVDHDDSMPALPRHAYRRPHECPDTLGPGPGGHNLAHVS